MKTYILENNYAVNETIDEIVVQVGGFRMHNYNEIRDSLMTIDRVSESQINITMADSTAEWAIERCNKMMTVSDEEYELSDEVRSQYTALHTALLEQFNSAE